MKSKYKTKFDSLNIWSRWRWSKYKGLVMDDSNCTLIGIGKRWFSPTEYEFILAFFGLEIRIWLKREYL